MTDQFPGIYRGVVGSESIVQNYIANGAIAIGAPVTWAAAGTGEEIPRVATTSTLTATPAGVVVDGDNRGTYGGVDTTITNPSNSANSAGQGVQVCREGKIKIQVNGSTNSIALGDPLGFDPAGNVGYAGKITVAGSSYIVLARALQASTAFGDYILADARIEGKF